VCEVAEGCEGGDGAAGGKSKLKAEAAVVISVKSRVDLLGEADGERRGGEGG
jgi:hypothetical protein